MGLFRSATNTDASLRLQTNAQTVLTEGSKGAYLKQQMQGKLIKHTHYIDQHGEETPEFRDWKWSDSI